VRLAIIRGRAEARPRSRLVLLALGWSFLCVALVGVVWVLVTALLARGQLNTVRSELPKLRAALTAGDMSTAHRLAADITAHAARAHELSTGPAWWVSANLPVVGTPLHTARTIAEQADVVGAHVLPAVIDLAQDVADMPHLTKSTIDLRRLASAAPDLHSAAATAHRAAKAVSATSGSWLGAVSSARNSVADALTKLDDELSGADRTVQVLLPMLGQSGTQRYMIGFMNEAESRGLGGIPGAFAIVTADHGTITFTHFGSDDELHGVRAKVDLGPEFDARYKQDDPTGVIQNSNLSPDFTYAARIWAGMWQAKTGQQVNGALAVDPTALSYLLKVTGPATLPDGTKLGATDVVALTQQKQYEMFGSDSAADKTARKAYLSTLAKAAADKITHGGNGTALVRALSHAATERRLVVWSADPAVEKLIIEGGWAGVLEPGNKPFSGFVVNNAAGSKLDYYLDRTMTYSRTGCGANGRSVATFTVTNGAPRSGLPAYVTTRADSPPESAKPGDNRLLITYYGSAGATVRSVAIDGKAITLASIQEDGLVTVTADLELPAGATRTITVVTDDPASTAAVTVLRQPLVNPMSVSVHEPTCG
jgi:hypothetical protein